VRHVNKKQWNKDLETLQQVINGSFSEEWEFHPFTHEEIHEFFGQMKQVLDSRQMLIAEVKGKPAGFCFGLPDWNPLFRSLKGRLGPIQIIKFMFGVGRYNRAGMINIGVLPEYHGTGVAQALAATLYRRYEERGLREAFYYPVNEINIGSRKFAEAMGGKGRVLYHCYDKHFSSNVLQSERE
jgi:GNAT superfamily N-acetyltransferase